jgi:GT2 family glycosyltransferase
MPDEILTHNDAPKIYILILNWNNWQDTIECLESVFRNEFANCRVIICDNGSTDGSTERIKAWAEGQLDVFTPQANSLRPLSFPPIQKPVAYCEYSRSQAEAREEGNRGGDDGDKKLILIETGANLGFAGGNNVGLRYALARNDFDYVWLLNNDTVVKPDALTHLVHQSQSDARIGMCGSTLLYYHHPDTVQTMGGGSYNKWFGLSSNSSAYQSVHATRQTSQKIDYVMGASMLVSRQFLQEIGVLSEDYFLYFEELDWATRAAGKFTAGYAPKSIVYHKDGQSVGNAFKALSPTSVFYSVKSRVKFTRKFYPAFLPMVYARLFLSLGMQVIKGKLPQATAIWKALTSNSL